MWERNGNAVPTREGYEVWELRSHSKISLGTAFPTVPTHINPWKQDLNQTICNRGDIKKKMNRGQRSSFVWCSFLTETKKRLWQKLNTPFEFFTMWSNNVTTVPCKACPKQHVVQSDKCYKPQQRKQGTQRNKRKRIKQIKGSSWNLAKSFSSYVRKLKVSCASVQNSHKFKAKRCNWIKNWIWIKQTNTWHLKNG